MGDLIQRTAKCSYLFGMPCEHDYLFQKIKIISFGSSTNHLVSFEIIKGNKVMTKNNLTIIVFSDFAND